MEMQSDYRIYVGDTPGPTLRLLFEMGKLVVDYIPEVARKIQESSHKLPLEDGRISVTRLYGEQTGRVYDAYRMAELEESSSTTYSRYIGKLFHWMDDNNITQPVAEVEEQFVEFLVSSRKSFKDPKGRSVRRLALFAIRKLKEVCCEEDIQSTSNPPPPPEPKPPTSETHLRSLFDHVGSLDDMVMLVTTNVVEATANEAVKLTWDDFDSTFEHVTIGEGEDAECRELDPVCRKFFSELGSVARSSFVLADSGAGLPEPVPVTNRSLQYRFRRVADRSGIPKWTTLTTTRKADAITSDLLAEMMEKYLPKFLEELKAAGDDGG